MAGETIVNIIKKVAEVASQIDGLTAFDAIPNAIPQTPALLIEPDFGTFVETFGGDNSHNLILLLIATRADLPEAANKVLPLFKPIQNIFDANKDLHGSCDTSAITGYRNYGRHEFAGIEYFGVEFTLWVLE